MSGTVGIFLSFINRPERGIITHHVKGGTRLFEYLRSGEAYEEEKVLTNKHIDTLEKNIDLSNEHIKNLQNDVNVFKSKNEELEIGIQAYRKGIDDLTNLIHKKDHELDDYANQLRTISNSISWKLTKPIRILSWVLNPFNRSKFYR